MQSHTDLLCMLTSSYCISVWRSARGSATQRRRDLHNRTAVSRRPRACTRGQLLPVYCDRVRERERQCQVRHPFARTLVSVGGLLNFWCSQIEVFSNIFLLGLKDRRPTAFTITTQSSLAMRCPYIFEFGKACSRIIVIDGHRIMCSRTSIFRISNYAQPHSVFTAVIT